MWIRIAGASAELNSGVVFSTIIVIKCMMHDALDDHHVQCGDQVLKTFAA